MPYPLGTVQPVLRRNHTAGDHRLPGARSLAHENPRRAEDDYRSIPDPLPVLRVLWHAKASGVRVREAGARRRDPKLIEKEGESIIESTN